LQLLMAAQRSIAKQGHELRLTNASSAVKDVLTAYGLDATLLPVNLEEAAS
jgi:ABC-type transporter Mla MlaB component